MLKNIQFFLSFIFNRFAYNKAKTTEGAEQAGMILGFGLNGDLTSMPATLQHDYLSKENSFMSMAMLLGLGVNKAGWKTGVLMSSRHQSF